MKRLIPSISALLGALFLLVACPGPVEIPFTYEGEPGATVPADFYSDVPQVDVSLDGVTSHPFLVDTGAPATLVDVTVFDVDPGVYRAGTLETFGLTVTGLDCAALNLFGGALTVGGILGGDIFRHFALAVDYQTREAGLHGELYGLPAPGEGDWGPTVSRGFDLRGGGVLQTPSGGAIPVAATRVVVPLIIEGHEVLSVVDTGASSIVLNENLYGTLLDERPERPVLLGLEVLTVEAAQQVEITRLAAVTLPADVTEDAVQTSVPALVVLGSTAFSSLTTETGKPIGALLGGSFLRAYRLTIDYPARRISLQPYRDLTHMDPDEYVSVGIVYDEPSPGEVIIQSVVPGSDADTQGVLPGDRILRVEGYDVTLSGRAGVDTPLAYALEGDELSFTLERGQSQLQLDLLVEDLLPAFE